MGVGRREAELIAGKAGMSGRDFRRGAPRGLFVAAAKRQVAQLPAVVEEEDVLWFDGAVNDAVLEMEEVERFGDPKKDFAEPFLAEPLFAFDS